MTYRMNYLLFYHLTKAQNEVNNKKSSKRKCNQKRANGLHTSKIREDSGRTAGYTDIANTSTN